MLDQPPAGHNKLISLDEYVSALTMVQMYDGRLIPMYLVKPGDFVVGPNGEPVKVMNVLTKLSNQ